MTTRRLAAILAADVVGFSSMMEKDEEGTLARIKALQREVIEPKVKERGGRLVKTARRGAAGKPPRDPLLATEATPVPRNSNSPSISGPPRRLGLPCQTNCSWPLTR
jgi:class 3 adenylate cyclase